MLPQAKIISREKTTPFKINLETEIYKLTRKPSKHVDGSDDGVCESDDEAVAVHELDEEFCKEGGASIVKRKKRFIGTAVQDG